MRPNVIPGKLQDIINETLEKDYIERLKAHDWFYEHSDSYQVWKRGEEERRRLNEIRKQIDFDYKIWNQYRPGAFKTPNY
jgi:hypothetical protein